MYDLHHFALDVQTVKQHFPKLSPEEFLHASCMGLYEQCGFWGQSPETVHALQTLTIKTLSPVVSYLFSCGTLTPKELEEAQRIHQHSFAELSDDEQALYGDFGGGSVCTQPVSVGRKVM